MGGLRSFGAAVRVLGAFALGGCAGEAADGPGPSVGWQAAAGARVPGACFLLRIADENRSERCEDAVALDEAASGEVVATFGTVGGARLGFVGVEQAGRTAEGEIVARVTSVVVGGTNLPAAGDCTYDGRYASRFAIYCEATGADGAQFSAFLVGPPRR